MLDPAARSRNWGSKSAPRYWWHRLPGTDYVPSIYAELNDAEWSLIAAWYEETDQSGPVGECAVPLMSLLHGFVYGNRAERIVQLGTCSGYSAILLGFMLRRINARRGLFTLDIDPAMCAMARGWIERAGLQEFVEIARGDSLDFVSVAAAKAYLRGLPELIILDSSHEYAATLRELDLWYEALAPGGLLVLHDVSFFAANFDITREGGVHRAFAEWRKSHPEAETFCLNGESRSMDLPQPFYKDACGLGLVHKPQMRGGG